MNKLREFVIMVSEKLDVTQNEVEILPFVREQLSELIQSEEWLDESFKAPDSDSFSSYLLYCDPQQRFLIESSVFRPGRGTPVHNHTMWGAIGQLRGVERSTTFMRLESGRLQQIGEPDDLKPGETTSVSPADVDIHSVKNPSETEDSISIHVYGGHIGKITRHQFDIATGRATPFVAPYTNRFLPNIWL